MSKRTTAFKSEDSYLIPCPECDTLLPPNLKACWHCGHCLDPRLLTLKKRNDGGEK